MDPAVTGPSRLRRAEIIAVGSELLGADRTDTNSLFITQGLNDLGIEVAAKAVVGDRLDDLAGVFRDALERTDLVVLTGGLGPTDDDLTRTAVAKVLGRDLHEDADIVERIRVRFAARKMVMPETNRRQALVIGGATLLENTQGTAPGQWLDAAGRVVVLLPGPPREMRPMFERVAREILEPRSAGERLWRRSIRIVGRPESQADEMLQPLYRAWAAQQPPIEATILAAASMLELQISVKHAQAEAGSGALDAAAIQVAALFGPDLVSLTGAPLERVIGDQFRARGWRLAVAESCTGGLVTSRLTDIPGSSEYVERSIVAYSNQAKVDLLNVPASLIDEHGAVSEPVASAMAAGVRRLAGVEVGLAITGIAGPGGGTATKPVGTVSIAVDGPGSNSVVRTYQFSGSREMIKLFASTTALDRLRRATLQA